MPAIEAVTLTMIRAQGAMAGRIGRADTILEAIARD